MKTCSKCGIDKDISSYAKDRTQSSGVRTICKTCSANAERRRRAERGNEINAARRQRKVESEQYRNKINECQRADYQNHREQRLAQKRIYHQTSESKAIQSRWVSENRDKVRKNNQANAARRSARTADKILQDRIRLRPTNTKKCRKCHQIQPAVMYNNDRRAPDGLAYECRSCRIRKYRYVELFRLRGLAGCAYCGGPYEHTDHVWPLFLGGTDDPWNLLPACANCNVTKRAKNPWKWLEHVAPGQDHKKLLESWGIRWDLWPSAN